MGAEERSRVAVGVLCGGVVGADERSRVAVGGLC